MTTIVGIKTNKGVFLASDNQVTSGNRKLPVKSTKIMSFGNNNLIAGTGSLGSLQNILDIASEDLFIGKLRAKMPLVLHPLELVYKLGRMNWLLPLEFKRYETFNFLLGGSDENNVFLFSVDTGGAVLELDRFYSDGSGSQFASSILEEGYKPDLSVDDAVKLLVKAVKGANKGDIYTDGNVEVYGIVNNQLKKYFPMEKKDDKTS